MSQENQPRSSSKNRRRFERFNYTYKVTLMNGVKSFKSVCCDISLGGLRLKDPLPSSMVGLRNKVIIEGPGPHDSIMFDCKVIIDSAAPTRVSFSETDQDSLKRLDRWLQARKQQG